MPLSEHEQRLLDQIERALYAEDPKFATTVRATDLRTHYRRRIIRSGIGFAAGLGLLLGGVVSKVVAVGVAGFLVMLAAALLGLASYKRLGSGSPGREATKSGPPKVSFMERVEERWRRRREERGGF